LRRTSACALIIIIIIIIIIIERLQFIMAHALVLLKTGLGGPKLQYILRVSPCYEHPLLTQFDDQLRQALTKTCNITLTDDQGTQVSLPVCSGGLGVGSVSMHASSAFLASANSPPVTNPTEYPDS